MSPDLEEFLAANGFRETPCPSEEEFAAQVRARRAADRARNAADRARRTANRVIREARAKEVMEARLARYLAEYRAMNPVEQAAIRAQIEGLKR